MTKKVEKKLTVLDWFLVIASGLILILMAPFTVFALLGMDFRQVAVHGFWVVITSVVLFSKHQKFKKGRS